MSKKKTTKSSTALANVENDKELAAQAATIPWQMDGADDSDLITPIAVIYQDKKQRDKLGEHEFGTLVDSSTQEPITEELFVPLFGWKEYIAWKPRSEGGGIADKTRNIDEVPEGGLDWQDDNSEKIPPTYTIHRNFLVLFKGADAPVVLSFKSSSKEATRAAKIINTMMQRRQAMNKGPCFFEFGVKEVSNDKGEWYEPTVKFSATPLDASTIEGVKMWGQFKVEQIKTNDDEAGDVAEEAPF